MYPSSFKTFAMPSQILEFFTSTVLCFAAAALRRRVNISAIVSLIASSSVTCSTGRSDPFNASSSFLPARLPHARDQTRVRQLAEHDSGNLELPVVRPAAAGQLAAARQPRRRRIPRKLRQRRVILLFLQLPPDLGVLRDEFLLLL